MKEFAVRAAIVFSAVAVVVVGTHRWVNRVFVKRYADTLEEAKKFLKNQ